MTTDEFTRLNNLSEKPLTKLLHEMNSMNYLMNGMVS